MKLLRYIPMLLALSVGQSALAANFSFTGLGGVSSSGYSATSGGITVTVTTPGGNNLDYFSVNGIDGIGNSSGFFDPAAIQQYEQVNVSFSESVTIGSLTFNQWEGPDKAYISSAGGNLTFDTDSCVALTFSCTSETFGMSSLGAISSFTITGGSFGSAFLLAGLSDVNAASAVPVPAAGWLFISGLAALFGRKRFLR